MENLQYGNWLWNKKRRNFPATLMDMCLTGRLHNFQLKSFLKIVSCVQAWSITYHSWLTFVLLLWAMFMWMLPNQRKTMLRTSPFLVVYAEFLLVAQYIYGMNLTDNELPTQIQGLNLKQIGFEKYLHLPVKPLLVKVLLNLKLNFVLLTLVYCLNWFGEKNSYRKDIFEWLKYRTFISGQHSIKMFVSQQLWLSLTAKSNVEW